MIGRSRLRSLDIHKQVVSKTADLTITYMWFSFEMLFLLRLEKKANELMMRRITGKVNVKFNSNHKIHLSRIAHGTLCYRYFAGTVPRSNDFRT